MRGHGDAGTRGRGDVGRGDARKPGRGEPGRDKQKTPGFCNLQLLVV